MYAGGSCQSLRSALLPVTVCRLLVAIDCPLHRSCQIGGGGPGSLLSFLVLTTLRELPVLPKFQTATPDRRSLGDKSPCQLSAKARKSSTAPIDPFISTAFRYPHTPLLLPRQEDPFFSRILRNFSVIDRTFLPKIPCRHQTKGDEERRTGGACQNKNAILRTPYSVHGSTLAFASLPVCTHRWASSPFFFLHKYFTF